MANMILFIQRQARKNAARRSGMVSPSAKPLQDFLDNGFLNIRRTIAPCYSHAEQIVTGLDLPPLHRRNSFKDHPYVFVHGEKQFLRHPDCAESDVRLPSVKNWNTGLPMRAARDVMKYHSYNVVVQGGKRGGDLVEKRNENCNMASNSRDAHYPIYNKLSRVKEGSYATSGSKQSSTSRDSKLAQFIGYQTPSVHQQSDQQPLSTDGHSSGGPNTRSRDMIYPLPVEELILGERRLYKEKCHVNDTKDNKPNIVPVTCQVCHNNKVDCVLLPCGDAKTCTSCGTRLFNSGRPCCFCNQTVGTVHPIYQ